MSAAPPILARVPLNNAWGVTTWGGFAFVACKEDGVFGVDLTNAASPAVKGALVAPKMDARRLAVDQGRLFVAAFGGGLHVYDVRNPNHPVPLGGLSTALIPYVEDVFAWGGYAFIVGGDGVNARFAVVDARVPSALRILGGYTHVAPEPTNNTAVAFDGRQAFVGTNKGELHVLDLSNLGRIARAGEYFCKRHEFRPPMVSGLVAFPGRVFVADWGAGLIVLDTRNPFSPREMGVFQGGTTVANAYRVAVDRSTVYVANGWGGLLAVDATSPLAMRLLWENAPARASFTDVTVAGPFALVANNGTPQGLDVIRVTPESAGNAGKKR